MGHSALTPPFIAFNHIGNTTFFHNAFFLKPFHKQFFIFFCYENVQMLIWTIFNQGRRSRLIATVTIVLGVQGLGDGLVHDLVYGLEAHGALDETVDAQLVVQHPAGALAGRDAGEDQHGLAGVLVHQLKELPSLLLEVHLEGHSVLRIVEHFQQTPRPIAEGKRGRERERWVSHHVGR